MKTLILQWEQTNLSNMNLLEDTYFYAFTRGNNLLYIGMSKRQDIIDEIKQNISRFGLKSQGLSIWLGYVVSDNRYLTQFLKITEKIILDAECLLIYTYKPALNQNCKNNYSRNRFDFRVVNKNFLKSVSIDKNGNIKIE